MTAPWGDLGVPGHTNRGHEWAKALAFLGNPPAARLRAAAGTSLTNATFTPINFDTEDFDNYNGHSTTTNPSRYVCQVAGRYQLSGGVAWTSNASTSQRACNWSVNGTLVLGGQLAEPVAGAIERQYPARTLTVVLGVNDYVDLRGYQDSGGALSTSAANPEIQSAIDIRWVGLT